MDYTATLRSTGDNERVDPTFVIYPDSAVASGRRVVREKVGDGKEKVREVEKTNAKGTGKEPYRVSF